MRSYKMTPAIAKILRDARPNAGRHRQLAVALAVIVVFVLASIRYS